jgi:hypothetical protein
MSEPALVDYGIQTEQSDIRAHVSPQARRVMVYRTAAMLDLLSGRRYREASASQEGVEGITARGFLVPVEDVPDLRVLHFESYPWATFPARTATTTARGAAAVDVVVKCLRRGRFPLWVDGSETDRRDVQVSGTDIIIFCRQRIQVKCDWLAGRREWGCTGNLFIQTAERNPRRLT